MPEAPSGLPATIEGYRLLARALPETIVFMTDRALRFVLADGPALDTLSFSSAELEGQDARAYLRAAGRLDLLAAYEAALAGQESTGEAELTAGRTFTIRFCPLPAQDGVIPGVLAVAREVTREREAAAALAEREATFRLLAENSTDMIVRMTPGDRVLRYVSPACRGLFGWEPAELLGRHGRELIHPDDVPRVRSEFGAMADHRPVTTAPYRFLCRDGSHRWVEASGRSVLGADGQVAELQVAIRDVTDRRRLTEERREAEERFRSAFAHAAIGMALVAPEGRFVQVNDALCRITGYAQDALCGLTFQDITHPDDLASDEGYAAEVLAGRRTSYRLEKRCIHRDGHAVWIQLAVSLVRDGAGEPLHFVAQIQDISERKSLERRLRHLADTDPLTGLWNRRRFEAELAQQARRCERYAEQAALLVLDLDGFKAINDAEGHQAGDRALRRAAGAMRAALRTSDMLARIGGDEFAALLLHVSPVEAEEIAADLAGALAAAGGGAPLRASWGLAGLDEEHADPDAAFVAADRAMYERKHATAL